MIGKASEIKTAIVYSHYEYPNGVYTVADRIWRDIEWSINKKLQSLGNADVISIKHTSQAYGEGDCHESAIIIYKEADA
jgi:hypothetical protein